MEKYTFLAKNPRFCMQDRKITIANKANTCTEDFTFNTIIQCNEINIEETQIYRAEAPALQNNTAHSHISHKNIEQYNYELNKPQQ